MRPNQKIYGKKLQERRNALFLTQRQLADKVGISSERMGAIEQDYIAGIDRSRIPRFAAALKLTEAEFVSNIAVPNGDAAGVAGRIVAESDADAAVLKWFHSLPPVSRDAILGKPLHATARKQALDAIYDSIPRDGGVSAKKAARSK